VSYGPHRSDRAWSQQEDETDNGDTNELIDNPPDETDRLHQYVEDMLSGPEPYEGSPYDGTDSDDHGFYSDEPY
jgi:hypothetical protein